MILLGTYFTGQVPFQQVLLHGLIRDKYGKKMSKSLGNGVEPDELVKKYGCDSLRLFLLENNIWGSDLIYNEDKVVGILKMILLGTYFTGQVPFQQVLLHGLIRDKYGKKMSKSLGNGVEPDELVKKYGCDSLRLFLLENNIWGSDLIYNDGKKIIGSTDLASELDQVEVYYDSGQKYGVEEFDVPVKILQLEEDTAKSTYSQAEIKLDFNRAGNPLIELVTEPVFQQVETVLIFIKQLQNLLRYLGISQAKLEQGQLRVDLNFSLQLGDNYATPQNTYQGDIPPNSQVGPWELGYLGVLPIINPEVIQLGLKLAAALKMKISPTILFDRKIYNYFDLPKGYQITQQELPFANSGYLPIIAANEIKKVPVKILQLEEDTAKSTYSQAEIKLDFNRAGNPLIELVTEPVFQQVETVLIFIKQLQNLLRYLGISQAKLEQGQLRVDLNFSLQLGDNYGTPGYGIKNLNALANIERARGQKLLNDIDLDKCDNLVEIKILSNNLTSIEFLENLPHPKKLQVLNISDNNIQPISLEFLENFTNLKTLDIGNSGCYNQFHGSLKPLVNLKDLEKLIIDNTDIDSGLEYLPSSLRVFSCISDLREDAKVKLIEEELREYKGDVNA
ncbi:4001_t:CDS:2 [Entrophospora sp. SA101]|nr:4001_t:CDS:2 [Entrophospora sp. SA101]